MVAHCDIHDFFIVVYEGFNVFQIRLHKENRSKHMEWVLQNFNDMEQRYARVWLDDKENPKRPRYEVSKCSPHKMGFHHGIFPIFRT